MFPFYEPNSIPCDSQTLSGLKDEPADGYLYTAGGLDMF
jgi:hypothetical protein